MKKPDFTPGPWKLHDRAHCGVMSESGRLVANTGIHTSNVDPEAVDAENLANAKLISAAPEMFEVLKECESCLIAILEGREWGAIEEYINQAQEALAKARGEEINQPQGLNKEQ